MVDYSLTQNALISEIKRLLQTFILDVNGNLEIDCPSYIDLKVNDTVACGVDTYGTFFTNYLDILESAYCFGTIYAEDFVTNSLVADVEGSALSKLDNFAEWKNPDGSINYDNHYAKVDYVKVDKKNQTSIHKTGLSMEKRVAEMEKMILELKTQLNALTPLKVD